MFLLAIILLGIGWVHGTLDLHGNLGEYKGIPVNIHCKEESIKIGGITINNKPVNLTIQEQAQLKCKRDCEDRKNKFKHSPGKVPKGCTCVLGFKGFKVEKNDNIRIVYRCFMDAAGDDPMWEKGKKKGEVKEVVVGPKKKTKLRCPNDRGKMCMLFVKGVSLGDLGPDTGKEYPSLSPEAMTKQCFQEMTTAIKENSVAIKAGSKCTIVNEYDSELAIEYVCLTPGSGEVVEAKYKGKEKL